MVFLINGADFRQETRAIGANETNLKPEMEGADLNKTDAERETTVFLINGADFRQQTRTVGGIRIVTTLV